MYIFLIKPMVLTCCQYLFSMHDGLFSFLDCVIDYNMGTISLMQFANLILYDVLLANRVEIFAETI